MPGDDDKLALIMKRQAWQVTDDGSSIPTALYNHSCRHLRLLLLFPAAPHRLTPLKGRGYYGGSIGMI
ncbi:hypothetical protein E2C01_087230 [Portunus trituberculatus]|uniref:Uncharacterized protein n=1 Tax=Portunus trituberculatus TaxID=210409 RepID=A0A5B7JGR9_PORTR|nr:hypothetical protein [Portunus trituberculatus]